MRESLGKIKIVMLDLFPMRNHIAVCSCEGESVQMMKVAGWIREDIKNFYLPVYVQTSL